MKVWLDDVRNPPDGWSWVRTPAEAIRLLSSGMVSEISLDHDLGDDDGIGTGYDVLRWLEEMACTGDLFRMPMMHVHSMNPVARSRMMACVKSINKHAKGEE